MANVKIKNKHFSAVYRLSSWSRRLDRSGEAQSVRRVMSVKLIIAHDMGQKFDSQNKFNGEGSIIKKFRLKKQVKVGLVKTS